MNIHIRRIIIFLHKYFEIKLIKELTDNIYFINIEKFEFG
jgi:hypothetical protein